MEIFTQEELRAAFDQVTQGMGDWKAPINADIDVEHKGLARTVSLLKAAVMHFTATEARIIFVGTHIGRPMHALRVEAKGYRMGPAGDH